MSADVLPLSFEVREVEQGSTQMTRQHKGNQSPQQTQEGDKSQEEDSGIDGDGHLGGGISTGTRTTRRGTIAILATVRKRGRPAGSKNKAAAETKSKPTKVNSLDRYLRSQGDRNEGANQETNLSRTRCEAEDEQSAGEEFSDIDPTTPRNSDTPRPTAPETTHREAVKSPLGTCTDKNSRRVLDFSEGVGLLSAPVLERETKFGGEELVELFLQGLRGSEARILNTITRCLDQLEARNEETQKDHLIHLEASNLKLQEELRVLRVKVERLKKPSKDTTYNSYYSDS
ncbi:uncharacterized protein LOC135168010 [Diachasmimorpha longicaudata]|uniref:uncharacterized protein LOC135168010 n=1 Tax=Diachasmimorpha longicaudata TaxID=58733 RepID=UPI0030B8A55C